MTDLGSCYILLFFLQDPDAVVIDHLNFAVTESGINHSLIAADTFVMSNAILGDKGIEVRADLITYMV